MIKLFNFHRFNPVQIRFVSYLLLICSLSIGYANSTELQLVATGHNRAIIIVNGERHVLTTGSPETELIRLIEADTEKAIIQIDNEEITLSPDDIVAPILKEDGESSEPSQGIVTLWAESSGFFYANGSINEYPVQFLIDTGADTVAFSSELADRIGINYSNGRSGYANTASGLSPMKSIKLHSVSIENIKLYDVQASIIIGRFPDEPLLGGSFLNNLDMIRSGDKMELKLH